MHKKLARRASLAFDGGVEAEDGVPTAFRIWRAGDNTTDHGPSVFSERSASLLLEQQLRRGNRFSIDVNHLSLDPSAPLENQRAVGWFDIAVRDGELWAVNVEWTDTVRAGLAKRPPEWRYHSPAYDVDPDSGEILSLTNLAITNNPATWSVTALASAVASRRPESVKLEDIKAALEGADPDKKAAAWRAIAAAMASGDGDGEAEKAPDSEKKEAEGEEPEKKEAEAEEPEKKDAKKAEAEEPEKKDALKATVAAAVAEAIKPFVKSQESAERKTLLASRPDFDPELVKVLAKAPLATVRDAVATIPRKAIVPTSTETVQATRGAGQGSGDTGALPPDERAKLDERMGIKRIRATVRNEGEHQIFPFMTAEDARAARDAIAARNKDSK